MEAISAGEQKIIRWVFLHQMTHQILAGLVHPEKAPGKPTCAATPGSDTGLGTEGSATALAICWES